MHVTTTPRGLQRISFVDYNDNQSTLEQTSGIDYGNPTHDEPGTSFVLLGRKDAPIKLNMDQVAEMVEYLKTWLEDVAFVPKVASAQPIRRSKRAG